MKKEEKQTPFFKRKFKPIKVRTPKKILKLLVRINAEFWVFHEESEGL